MTRSVPGRRFFLADPRSQTAPGRVRLADLARELADPAAAARWFHRLDLGPLAAVAAAHGPIERLLAADPPLGDGDEATRRVRAAFAARGLDWLGDDGARLAHAERAWDALYAAHHGVTDAVDQVEPMGNVLRVCRVAELAYAGSGARWRELGDAAAARPMVPAEIYRSQRERRLRPPPHVVQAVALPAGGGERDPEFRGPVTLAACSEED